MPRKSLDLAKRKAAAKLLQRAARSAAARRKTTSTALTSKIKNIQLNQCETKRKGWYFGALTDGTGGVIQLGHNITEYWATIYATKQSITNPNGAMNAMNTLPYAAGPRIGNEIIPKAISIKLQLDNVAGSGIHYKLILFEYDSNIPEGNVKDSLLWYGKNGEGVDNVLRTLDSIAVNRVKVLKQYSIYQNEDANSTVRQFYIPLKNRKLRYTDNGNVKPFGKDCALALVAVGRMTEPQGQHIANASFALKFTYKDP